MYNLEIKPLSVISFVDIFSIMCVKVVQLCPTLCYPMDCRVHGILQARILEWVAFPFSRDLPSPRIKPRSTALQADSLPVESQRKPIFIASWQKAGYIGMYIKKKKNSDSEWLFRISL